MYDYFMNKSFYLILAILLFSACTSEKPSATGGAVPSPSGASAAAQGAAAPAGGAAFSVEITPQQATRKSTLLLTSGMDLSAARIEWLVNGNPFTPPAPTQFSGADVAKGASVQAKVTIDNREALSNIVTIMNGPPEITGVKLLPEVLKPGDNLFVEAEASDIDGDRVTLSYEWTKNGVSAGKTSKLEAQIKRGDKISLTITPFDGEDYGRPVIFEREIQNLPPEIVDHNDFTFDGTTCTYQARASDPDGDTLAYSLESPQQGMTIDPATGLFKWVVPAEFKGKQEVNIKADDGHNGISRYCIRITIE